MPGYIIRLDDAAERMDTGKWNRMEDLLDAYGIKPLTGVIPSCRDSKMNQYCLETEFWAKVRSWQKKGWVIALHGYEHVYITRDGGLNPIQKRSEFAGVPLTVQEKKIEDGIRIMREQGVCPKVFFAPSHTFDINTVRALKAKSDIRIISDTIANQPYSRYGMTFVPVQAGKARRLPLHTVTVCYHPNLMTDPMFFELEIFIKRNRDKIIEFPCKETDRKASMLDITVRGIYFLVKRIWR